MSAFDVVIIGGGPGGLQAALTLGRARKRVLLCDSGPRRNAAAKNVHNFVTRDGTPPDEFRAVARKQLGEYPSVIVRDVRVESITGSRGEFRVNDVEAKRVLLCTGMIDDALPIEGWHEQWGHSIFQCPYCHGWEVRDQPWGYLVLPSSLSHFVPFTIKTRGWTRDVTVFTNGIEIPAEAHAQLAKVGIPIEARPIRRIAAGAIELADGAIVPCAALFAHPPQRQVDLVRALDLALDEHGYVKTDPMTRETSRPGVYAAGDLASRMQAAIAAAAAGMQAAAAINLDLALS